MANAIAPGFTGVPGQSWQTRLREAAYTSPIGTRIRFLYEDVSREFDKRGTVFEFPDVEGAYVQQRKFGARRYPLRCIFSGANCDLQAAAFEAALLQDGIGRLEHPAYGTVNVVPFGSVTRTDALKTAANQSIVEVTFWTTVGSLYPQRRTNQQNEILDALGAFDVAAAQRFADAANLRGAVNQANGKATFRKFLQRTSAALEGVSNAVTSVNRSFRDLQSEINFGMDVLIGQPLLLARQVVNLVKAPARALVGIKLRLDDYSALATSITSSVSANPAELLTSGTALAIRRTKIANDFHIADLFALAAMAGAATAAVAQPIGASGAQQGTQFTTRPEAIAAAVALVEQFDALVDWRDAGFAALGQIPEFGAYQVDTGEAYQALQQAVALAAGYLIQLSFTLLPERRLVLDRPRTIIDLAAELYGTVDDRLDFLISTNNLVGDEILELEAGREVVYYASS